MVIVRCDACGEGVKEMDAVPMALGRSSPLDALLGRPQDERHSARFDLCPECAATLILTFKSVKARSLRGERELDQ